MRFPFLRILTLPFCLLATAAPAHAASNIHIICAQTGLAYSDQADVFTVELKEPSKFTVEEFKNHLNRIDSTRVETTFVITHYKDINFRTGQEVATLRDQLTQDKIEARIPIVGTHGGATISIRADYITEDGKPYRPDHQYVEFGYSIPRNDSITEDRSAVVYRNKRPRLFSSGNTEIRRTYACTRPDFIDLSISKDESTVPPASGQAAESEQGAKD